MCLLHPGSHAYKPASAAEKAVSKQAEIYPTMAVLYALFPNSIRISSRYIKKIIQFFMVTREFEYLVLEKYFP